MSVDRAAYLSGVDPDYSLKDLFEAIASRNFVSIHLCGWFPKWLVSKVLDTIVAQHSFRTGYVKLMKIVRFSDALEKLTLLNQLLTNLFSQLSLSFLDRLQPSWTLYIQVMTFEQAEKFRWNPFDLTKVCVYFLFYYCLQLETLALGIGSLF